MAEYDDLVDMGFEEIKPKQRKEAPPKKSAKKEVKVIAPDPSEVIRESNQQFAAAMAAQNATLKKEMNKLVTAIKPKPKKMRVTVNRNSAGFADSFDIDVEY